MEKDENDHLLDEFKSIKTNHKNQNSTVGDSMSESAVIDIGVNEKEQLSCRICLEDCERKEVIAPCNCSGSSAWVHRRCLDQWRTTREDKAFSRCTECLSTYVLISRQRDDCKSRSFRYIKFSCHVSIDVGAVFALSQLVVGSFAYLIYVFDGESSFLLNYFSMKAYPFLFYYIAGLSVSLACLGVVFYTKGCGCCEGSNCCEDSNCCASRRSHSHYGACDVCPYYYWDGYGTYPNHHACICCCDGCCDGCCVLGQGSCDSAACCQTCTATEVGGEAAALLLVVFALMALLGIFVAVYLGSIFVKNAVQSHSHYLYKRGLADDIIVADLRPGGIEEFSSIPDENELQGVYSGTEGRFDQVASVIGLGRNSRYSLISNDIDNSSSDRSSALANTSTISSTASAESINPLHTVHAKNSDPSHLPPVIPEEMIERLQTHPQSLMQQRRTASNNAASVIDFTDTGIDSENFSGKKFRRPAVREVQMAPSGGGVAMVGAESDDNEKICSMSAKHKISSSQQIELHRLGLI